MRLWCGFMCVQCAIHVRFMCGPVCTQCAGLMYAEINGLEMNRLEINPRYSCCTSEQFVMHLCPPYLTSVPSIHVSCVIPQRKVPDRFPGGPRTPRAKSNRPPLQTRPARHSRAETPRRQTPHNEQLISTRSRNTAVFTPAEVGDAATARAEGQAKCKRRATEECARSEEQNTHANPRFSIITITWAGFREGRREGGRGTPLPRTVAEPIRVDPQHSARTDV